MKKLKKIEKFRATFKGEKFDHLWGYEVWIENNELYCNKLLVVNKGYLSSLHFHKKKDETFIILKGKVKLVCYHSAKPNPIIYDSLLYPGDTFRIFPGEMHQFESIAEQSIIMEVSLTDNNDNVKIQPAKRKD
jgi:D-lyxose ketol-isomerase